MKQFFVVFTILLVLVICQLGLAQSDVTQAEKTRVLGLLARCQMSSPSLNNEAIEASRKRSQVLQSLMVLSNQLIAAGKERRQNAYQAAINELGLISTRRRGLVRIQEFINFSDSYISFLKDHDDCHRVRSFFGSVIASGSRILCQLFELDGSENEHPECDTQFLNEI